MYPQIELSESFKRQMGQLANRYSKEITSLENKKKNKKNLFMEIGRLYAKDEFYEKKGYGQLLPVYFIMQYDFELAWTVAHYLNIRWHATSQEYNEMCKILLENSAASTIKPFHVILHNIEQIRKNHYAPMSPFDVDNQTYNDMIFDANLKATVFPGGYPYNPAAEARYDDLGDDRQFHMTYFSINEIIKILPIAFRQERYTEVVEILFRLRYILSTGEPPKIITEGPRHRHYQPFLNMYYIWFQARFAEDEGTRKVLAQEALFWCIETGIRTAGTKHLKDLSKFTDFCEIIGEFQLLGERHEDFLRNFKKWTMHASISFFKKMRDNPIQPIPFSERHLPTYNEFKTMYEQTIRRT